MSDNSRGRLACRDIRVSFGGLDALSDVSLDVPAGSFAGLIGPNGSGKTTLLNVISGLQPARSARIELDGRPVAGLSATARARLGVARTFQTLRLFDTLSVIDNVLMGAHSRCRHSLFESCLHTLRTRREAKRFREEAEELLSRFGDRLLPRLKNQVVTLSYANRRRVEIARALMGDPAILLLDEPSAGMNPSETDELADQLPVLVSGSRCSVLVVEHKMDFIAALCPKVYVLDHGSCLAEGSADDVQTDPRVQEAFLGIE